MARSKKESMGIEKGGGKASLSSYSRRRKGILTTKSPKGIRKRKEKSSKKDVGKGIEKCSNKKRKKKKNKKRKKLCSMIQVGDTLNLSDLLFTNYRDYLIIHHHNNTRRIILASGIIKLEITGNQVKAKDLAGKVIVLHFMSFRCYFDTWRAPVINLRDIYTKLHPKGDFEIVFVALGGDDFSDAPLLIGSNTCECFREIVSMMPPCPAIPLSDRKSIKRLDRIFGITENFNAPVGPESFIIDPRGVVLQSYATPLLLRYGAAGFPFTNERIKFLDSEDNLVRRQPFSVEKYLASPERDYLINNKGDQVPLKNIDDKVVGLYFCPCLDGLKTTRDLQMVYQELSKNKEDFEIVLIYTHGWCEHEYTCGLLIDEVSFLDEIKTMPWLALPFTDTDCNKKLQRIFQNPQDLQHPKPAASLVIIGPHGKFIEPLATKILAHYGASAYPFTLQSAVNLQLERVKKVKAETFWNLDAIFTQIDGSQVRFSEFVGKRIIVLYQTCNWRGRYETLGKLKARYFQMKGTDDEFEVIHIRTEMWYSDQFEAPMPWLMHPPFDHNSYEDQFILHVFGDKGGIIAFDCDGLVVRATTNPLLGDDKVFPFFHDGDMGNEILLGVKVETSFRLESVFENSWW